MQVHLSARDEYPLRSGTCGVSEAEEPVLDWSDFLIYWRDYNYDDEDFPATCDECLAVALGAVALLN